MCEWENMPGHIDEKYVGFVYIITRLTDGKFYIGKKLFSRRIKSRVNKVSGKGKKTRIRKVESDWRDYWGSSAKLLKDIKQLGKKAFSRRLLHLCESKLILSYIEAAEQIKRDAIFDRNSYNEALVVRLRNAKP
jgi:hypothetical protein